MTPSALRRLSLPIAVAVVVAVAGALLPILTSAPAAAGPEPAAAVPVAARAGADDAEPLARVLPDFRLDRSRPAYVRPTTYAAASVDLAGVRDVLGTAATTRAVGAGAAPTRVLLPAPDGTLVAFDVAEDSVMEAGIQARHPELRTYAGTGVSDPTDTVRLAVTPLGLSASVRSVHSGRVWYVDPAYRGRGVTSHLSYLRAAVPRLQRFTERDVVTPARATLSALSAASGRAARVEAARRAGEVVVQRTYRMAFVTTPSYAEDFGTANVLAEKVRTVNRANHVYSDDMAIKFVLVDGSEALNLDTLEKATGANGPCGASPCFEEGEISSCGGSGIDRNNFVAGQIVGADSFDIGHLGSGAGSGGVAYLGVVGGELKAGGCTALDEPRGDFYAIDYFAHEVGHQMGGNHTFDGNDGSCAAPNRNAETSVEPGSGSSVMAYAGICATDDLQPHTDPYFSQRTIDEFTAVTTATPDRLSEQQTASLRDFGAGDSFALGYPGQSPITVTSGDNYTAADLEAALQTLTGKAVEVSGYDGANAVGAAGFTMDWPDTSDAARVTLSAFSGASGFVGVLLNGGPTTNQGIATRTANHRPVVDAGADRQIPIRTPFVLTGTASDVDAGDAARLTYLWEQNDSGLPGDPILGTGPGTTLGTTTRLAGPLFRVFGTFADVSDEDTLLYNSPGQNLVDGVPSRSFPDLDQVLAGNTNAETGMCPPASTTDPMTGAALDCYSELLPDAEYALSPTAGELDFRLTVRDGSSLGGGTGFDDVTLTPSASAGPFLVTSRETAGEPATAGGTETVEWDVAGTAGAGLAPQVRISVSLDGGHAFAHVVAASTPNDGSQQVTLPRFNTEQARIKIQAVGNYFYDVNDADFVITGGVDPEPPAPPGRPQTTLSGAVPHRGFVVGARNEYEFASSVPGSTFTCRLDGTVVPCAGTDTGTGSGTRGSLTLTRLTPGTHVLTVAARGPEGRRDASPARRAFSVVGNDTVLRKQTDGWRTVADDRFYRGTYALTRQRGQLLSTQVTRMKRFAVLVSKAQGFGRIEISLDGRPLKTINLASRQSRSQVLLATRAYPSARSGRLTIRSLDAEPVLIDGLGVFSGPPR